MPDIVKSRLDVSPAFAIEEKVRRTQVELLFGQLPQGLAATLLNSALLVWVLSGVTPQAHLNIWMTLMLCVCAARAALLTQFRRVSASSFDEAVWRNRYFAGATATALLWGIAGGVLFPPSSVQHHAFIGFVLAGMTAGASSSMSADDRIFRVYLFLAIAPFIIRLVATGETVNLAMAAMGVAFMAAMSISARKSSQVTADALRLRYENSDLIGEVTKQADALKSANSALVTENQQRQTSEIALQRAMDDLQVSMRAKSQFLATMSHEIRTPMNGVFGMTDLLLRTKLDDRQKKLVLTISESAKSLLTIINDILDLSRIESGKLDLDHHEFILRDAVEKSIDLLASQAHSKGIDLTVFVDRDVPYAVKGDSGRLKQILLNLTGNAIKFTPHGQVTIRVTLKDLSETESRLQFVVRDTGIGIDPALRDKLFQPFTQAETSISRRFGGTGLGLSISKHLIALMGGKIELESELGKGTEVRFELPLGLASAGTLNSELEPDVLDGARILVIDDSETNREILGSYLSSCGCEVNEADSAGAAWPVLLAAAATEKPFHAAIVDMIMPNENGIEFAARVKASPELARLKLIMATSIHWQGDLASARNAGVEAVLTKPLRRNDIIEATARAISGQRHHGWRRARSNASVDQTSPAAQAGDATPRVNARVLLVEDNPVNIEVAYEVLVGLGCRVQIARNGLEAVAQFKFETFDIVLMDCQMPVMDGLTATRRIRDFEIESGSQSVPVIAVTANAYAEDKARCLEAGMDDYISKPYTEAQLQNALHKWATQHAIKASQLPAPAKQADAALPEMRESVLDEGTLAPLRDKRPDLFQRLIRTYLDYAPTAMAQLKAAHDAGDAETLGRHAHSLKSSSANLGALTLSALCRDLESAVRDDKQDDLAGLVTTIGSAYEAVSAALTAEIGGETAADQKSAAG